MASITFGYNYGKAKKAGGVSYDANAQAFFTATGITDTTQKSAVNQLVLDLKSYNIWTKMKAVYPIVGGTSTTHKYNLINPADTDEAFRLTFSTGWTHSSTGMTPASAYASTFLATSAIGQNSGHYSVYIRTNNTTQAADIGSYQTNTDSFSYLYTYITGALRDYRYCDNATGLLRVTGVTSTTGLFLTSRTASNVIKGFRNGSVEGSGSNTTTGTSNYQIILGAYNNAGTATAYSNRQQCFASIGTGLTDTEAANFYTAVQAYQTTLGRQV